MVDPTDSGQHGARSEWKIKAVQRPCVTAQLRPRGGALSCIHFMSEAGASAGVMACRKQARPGQKKERSPMRDLNPRPSD